MPIAQAPANYRLQKPGTVGVPISSNLCIASTSGEKFRFGQDGEICLRGPVVMAGYSSNIEANCNAFLLMPAWMAADGLGQGTWVIWTLMGSCF